MPPEISATDLPLDRDLPCARCAYNLRSQPTNARCPECDLPIADSLAHDDDLRTHLRPGRIAAAAILFTLLACWNVLSSLGEAFVPTMSGAFSLRPMMDVFEALALVDHLAQMLVCGGAVALLWNSGPTGAVRLGNRVFLALSAFPLLLADIIMSATIALWLFSPHPAGSFPGSAGAGIYVFAILLFQAALWFFFATTARFCRSRILSLATHLFFAVAVVEDGIVLLWNCLLLLRSFIDALPAYASLSEVFELLYFLNLSITLMAVGYWVTVLVIMVRVSRRIHISQLGVSS